MKVSSVSEMRELDRKAIEAFGIKDELLMENAGLAVYSCILENLGIAGKDSVSFVDWATTEATDL